MTEPLDELLRRNARVQDQELRATGLVDSMDAAWLEARAEAGAGAPAVPRRSHRRGRVAAAAALVVVAVGAGGAPAFADWVGLHTGSYDTGPKREHNPSTPDRELWRMSSPELAPHLQAWERDYPLAPGHSLDPLIDDYSRAENSQMTAAGFRDSVFFYSECTWVDYWVTADRAGRTTARREATQGLADTVAKLDSPARINLDQPGRMFLVALVGAARAGDAGPLERERRINCDWQFR